MKQISALILMIGLAGCTTIENHYTVTGDSNRFQCDSTASPIKTIDTGLSASASNGGSAGSEVTK